MTIDIANSLYVVCVAVGGLLLIMSVVLDDYLDRSLETLRIRFELGGASFVQLLLAFLSAFGIGGLIGTLIVHTTVSNSAWVGVVVGLIGVVITVALFAFSRRRGRGPGFDLDDLVGKRGSVDVAITPTDAGSVTITYAGEEQHHPATAMEDIAAGVTVMVTDATATSIVVAPVVEHG